MFIPLFKVTTFVKVERKAKVQACSKTSMRSRRKTRLDRNRIGRRGRGDTRNASAPTNGEMSDTFFFSNAFLCAVFFNCACVQSSKCATVDSLHLRLRWLVSREREHLGFKLLLWSHGPVPGPVYVNMVFVALHPMTLDSAPVYTACTLSVPKRMRIKMVLHTLTV